MEFLPEEWLAFILSSHCSGPPSWPAGFSLADPSWYGPFLGHVGGESVYERPWCSSQVSLALSQREQT